MTDIRDAFDERVPDFSPGERPPQCLPDHRKKEDPVSLRTMQDGIDNVVRRHERRARRRSEAAAAPRHAQSTEMAKTLFQVLLLTSALALHFALSRTLVAYFDHHFVSAWNQACLALIYAASCVLATWYVKTRV